ncbi:MAG: FtsX-like permease family protein [Candidatus Nanopelagicales bacterium]
MLKATWRSLKAHKARMLLSGLAVVLGVAFVVGTFIFTDTLKGTFDQLFSGQTPDVVVTQQLEVGGDDGTGSVVSVIPAETLDTVRALPGVRLVTGDVQVQGVALIDVEGEPIGGNGPPQLGVSYPEFPDEAQLSGVTLVEGRAPSAPEEIAVDETTAEKGGFSIGDMVTVVTQGPRIQAPLVGIVRFGVSGSLGGVTLTLFERQYAQDTFIGSDAWNQVSVLGDGSVSNEALRDEVATELGSGYEVKTGQEVQDETAAQFSSALGFINTFLLVFAFIALFVGTFIILNTFSMLVARRTKELALLRAIGASKRQITWSVVGEAFLLGLLGGVLGIGLGILVALGLRGLLAAIGAELPAGELVIAPRTVIVGVLVGVVVTVFAAWFPARRASQVPPVAAMRDEVALPARSLRLRAISGGVLTAVGLGLIALSVANADLPRRLTVFGVAAASLLIGVIVLAPVFSRALVGFVGAPIARSGAVGRLAVRNAQRDRRRTAATATAILIGLALVTAIGVLGSSTTKSVNALVDDVLTADFIVQPTSFVPFSPEVGDALAAVPGVASVSRIRQAPALVDGQETDVIGVDPQTINNVQSLGVEPSALVEGSVVVDVTTAAAAGVQKGDEVEVTWGNSSTDTLTIGQVYPGADAFSGWVVSIGTLEAAGLPPVDSLVYVTVDPEADSAAVRTAVEAVKDNFPTVQILDQTEFKDSITGQINQLINLIYGLLGLSVIIAIFGVVNTLALSIIERTREIGMLRAVGTLRRQVRTMIRWESIVISFFGAFTGVGLGLLLGIALQRLLVDEGISELGIPWSLIGIVLVATAIVGVLAAVWPARRAANLDVLAAIRTE